MDPTRKRAGFVGEGAGLDMAIHAALLIAHGQIPQADFIPPDSELSEKHPKNHVTQPQEIKEFSRT